MHPLTRRRVHAIMLSTISTLLPSGLACPGDWSATLLHLHTCSGTYERAEQAHNLRRSLILLLSKLILFLITKQILLLGNKLLVFCQNSEQFAQVYAIASQVLFLCQTWASKCLCCPPWICTIIPYNGLSCHVGYIHQQILLFVSLCLWNCLIFCLQWDDILKITLVNILKNCRKSGAVRKWTGSREMFYTVAACVCLLKGEIDSALINITVTIVWA